MIRISKILFICLIVFLHQLNGQNNPITINVAVNPPYSTDFTQYISSASQTVITIVNSSQETFNVFLAGSIQNLTVDKGVRIPANEVPQVPPLVISPGVRIINGSELQLYINPASLEYQGLSQQEVINGNLPEGLYQICLQAIDFSTLEPRSAQEPSGCSNVFQVSFLQPPLLINPFCGSETFFTIPQNVNFTWVPPVGVPLNAILSYRFKIVEILQGQNPIQAMQSTSVPIVNDITNNNFYLLTAIGPALQSGREYAWQVTAEDLAQNAIFSNGGKSEICTFRMGIPTSTSNVVQANIVYPAPGVKIPFRNVPIVARFEPFSIDDRGFSVSTQVNNTQGGSDQSTTQQSWPLGRETFVQQQINQEPTLEQLQQISVGRNLLQSPGSGILTRGAAHTVQSELSLQMENGQSRTTTASSTFLNGMPAPKLISPVRDTTSTSHTVTLKFNPENFLLQASSPPTLLPNPEIIKSLTGTNPYWFIAKIEEKYKIEISRRSSFDTIINTKFGQLEINDTIKTNKTQQALLLKISRQIKNDFFLADTGRYFWRVSYLSNQLDSTSSTYITSESGSFFISDGIAGEQVNSACMGECDAPAIADRVPVTTIQIGDSITIGKFKMRITEISYLGPAARGKGNIQIPFLRSVLKVTFNDLQINASKQVFSGTAGAEYDNSSLLPRFSSADAFQTNLPNADSLQQFFESRQPLLTSNPNTPIGLPLGLDKRIEDENITIAVVAASFKPERATLAAALNIPLFGLRSMLDTNGLGINNLTFGASDICFHPFGLAGASMGTLYMPEDVDYVFAPGQRILLNGTKINLATGAVADSGCYVSWDCDGFRALNIKGAVNFDTTMLIAENLVGNSDNRKRVEARFAFTVRKTGNWMAALDFDKFQIPGIKGWGFDVQEATLDFSDLSNPVGMQFPANYAGDRSVLWNGFHLKKLSVSLPKEFGEDKAAETDTAESQLLASSKRISFEVNNLLIDNSGVSGKLQALNLLKLENGSMDGWGFSIDSILLEVVSNSFVNGGFNGEMVAPISPDHLKYSSVLSQGPAQSGLRYEFRVLPKDTITVPLWHASVELLPTSFISILADTGGFKPSMSLNGNIGINTNIGEIPVRFVGVHFQQLKIETKAPFISCNTFSFASPEKKMAGFPVSVTNITLTKQTFHGMFSWDDTEGDRIALNFQVNVNFTGESNTFGGSTELAILGRIDLGDLKRSADEPDPHPNSFDFPALIPTGVDLKAILINADMGFVSVKGFFRFFAEDSIFGKGFMGGLDATFIKTITVKVVGGAGEINDHKYWYFDASAKFTPGIPIYSGLELFGFGGGAFYGMNIASLPVSAAELVPKTPTETPPPGSTLSSIRLIPDPIAGFGFKATIMFGSNGGGQVYNADVTLSGVFSTSGGLATMTLGGNAYFMTNPIDRTFQAVRAEVLLRYDFTQNILEGLFSVMINVPMTIVGRQAGNYAGSAYLYAGPDKWQILVGQPDLPSRVGVRVANMFDFSAYLMAGQQLPAPPDPPEIIEEILGPGTIVRSTGISSGTGLAFGASFIPPKFDQKYLVFSAKLDAEIGFDMNMFDYGATSCDGIPEGERLGINGWYAKGAVYAYLVGSIGIDVNMFGEVVNYKIVDVAAAALLQSGFPNPAWMKGTIGGRYNILGGLVKGDCRFELMIGTKCEPPVESPLAGIKMIGDISPQASTTGVDCGVAPQAAFNVDLNTAFVLPKNNSDGSVTNENFRFTIEIFTLKKGTVNVPVTLSTATDNTRAMITPTALLEPFTNYKLSLKVKAEKFQSGTWVQAKRINGTDISETLDISFTTGDLPDKIRDQDITYCLPLNRQRFFAQNTCESGFIQLRYSMAYLFNAAPASGYQRTYYARFLPQPSGTPIETQVTYLSLLNRVNFVLPTLSTSKMYKVQIIHRDVRVASSSNTQFGGVNLAMQGVSSQFTTLLNNNVELRRRMLSGGNSIANNEFLYYEYFFRTSMYQNVSDKINALSASSTVYERISPYENLGLNLSGAEKLEKFEVEGFSYTVGLSTQKFRILNIKDAYSNLWHTSFVQPVIYDLYNRIVNNNYSTRRFFRSSPDEYGIPPTSILYGNSISGPLSDSEVNPGMVSSSSTSFLGSTLITSSSGISGGGFSSGLSFNTNSQTSMLVLETGWFARDDYDRMGTIIANVKSRYGNSLSGVDVTTKAFINRYLNTPYKNMFRGAYQIRFTTVPVSNCGNPAPSLNTLKSFTY